MISEHGTIVRGTKIHWLEAGSGDEPFLLIHGFGSSIAKFKWLDALPLLGAERRAIALDLPGFGASDAPTGPYSPAWLAGVVRANRQMMWALSARREQTWRVLQTIQVPTLFIWGERDRLISVDAGEEAVRRLPGSELVVIDDCGHNPQMECPEEFSASTIAFARRVGAGAER